MENAVEALKIAFGVLVFILALTLSISSFSQANNAVTSIVNMRDRDRQILYEQIRPTIGNTRVVGAETIVPTLYRAYEENIEIYFKESDGITAMPLYYKTDALGKKVRDDAYNLITVDSLDLSKENFASIEEAKKHLNIILYGTSSLSSEEEKKYKEQILYPEGFYDFLAEKTFKEELGEYLQGSDSTAIKKRVITYTLIP